jgi:DNA-binding transcriptional LysR family regulator
MDLNEILVFARVAQTKSFTVAARDLRMPKSTVSRKVSELEERLKSRLLQRTTRKLSLTDAGRIYYEYCARIVAEVEGAERAVTSLQETPQGLLRVSAPVNFAFLGPILSDYLERYPEVRLELICTGRTVDLVEEGFDLGIRAGTLADSTLISRRLGSGSWLLVAAPSYLKKRGRPRSPEDLKERECLLFGTNSSSARLRLERGERSLRVDLSPRLLVSEMDVLHAAAIAGLGIALLPTFRCVEDLRAHRLERVLRDWNAPPTPIHVVYPCSRNLSPKVKSLIDHLQERMKPPPWDIEVDALDA